MDSLNGPSAAERIETLAARVAAAGEGSVIAVVRSGASVDWAASEALLLATLIADEHPRVILANLEAGPMDEQAAAPGPDGLTQALQGQVRVSVITSRLPGSGAFFFRAGRNRMSAADVLESKAFENLVGRVGEGGGLLLVYTPVDELPGTDGPDDPEPCVQFDGVILLGDVDTGVAERLGAPLLDWLDAPVAECTVEAEDPSVVKTSTGGMALVRRSDPGGSSRRWSLRRRSESGSPGLLQVFTIWLFAAAFVFVAWQAYAGWPTFERNYPDVAGEGVQLPLRDTGAGNNDGMSTDASIDDAANSAAGSGDADPLLAIEAAPESPYSILIASYTRWEEAETRLDEIARTTREVAFVAPTPLRGRVYYRVFVGANRDEREASALMETLVSDGVKEESRAWDMRPSRLAWLSGAFGSRDQAVIESDRLRSLELPAYILHSGTMNDRAFAVYFGAYESEEAAQALGETLRDTGVEAQLVVRKGVSR